MFLFKALSSCFKPKISTPEMSSSSSSSVSLASTCSDSDLSSPKISCYFNPSTCKYQSFSIPEKILYYMAKNATNAETFQKLIESCKYIFKVNPVVVVHGLESEGEKWYAYYDKDRKYRVGFKCDQPINFKIWVTHYFFFRRDASQLIPFIYKNDATSGCLASLRQPIKFEDLLFFADNAQQLSICFQVVKYENGKTVQLEDIVKHIPKLKTLDFKQFRDGRESNINSNTWRKLMELDHFKNITVMYLHDVEEALNVEEIYKYICENQDVHINLYYRGDISAAYKELVRKYSRRLKKENGCSSSINFVGMDYGNLNEVQISSSEDENSDTSFDGFVDNVYDA